MRRYYDGWANDYDATLAGWGYDAPARAIALLVGAAGGAGSVLDAGCGTGLVGVALRAAGFGGRLIGIDFSPASLERAAARSVYDETFAADLRRPLPFDDGDVDAVLCVGVLSYVPDTPAIWREFARVVTPAGVIVCTQRADVWNERRCNDTLHELECDGTWTAVHLSAPVAYLPGHADFGDEIGVRYLVARTRVARARPRSSTA